MPAVPARPGCRAATGPPRSGRPPRRHRGAAEGVDRPSCICPWRSGSADGSGSRAARCGIGDVARQADARRGRGAARIRHRHRREQRLGVGVPRPAEERPSVRPYSTTRPTYITATWSEMCFDDREVVRDEEIGEPKFVLQVLQQVEGLRPHRDVEGRDRLVRDDEMRAAATSARAMTMRWRSPPEKACG